MANCDLTFSTFSAGQSAAALNIRRGWHAKVADQQIDGKRYVGRVASAAATEPSLNTTKGHHSIIVDDCANGCKVYGSTYARAVDGKLKAVSRVTTSTPFIACGATAIRLDLVVTFTGGVGPGDCHQSHSGTYLLPAGNTGHQNEECGFLASFSNPVPGGGDFEISVSFIMGGAGIPQCVWMRYIVFSACGGTFGAAFDAFECPPFSGFGPWLGQDAIYPLSSGIPIGFIRNLRN